MTPYEEGSILQDEAIPKHKNMEELVKLAEDREEWKKRVNAIKYKEDSKHTLETTSKKQSIPKSIDNIVTRLRKREQGARRCHARYRESLED